MDQSINPARLPAIPLNGIYPMDVPKFDESNSAWLLTLPEGRIGGTPMEACKVVVIRTLKEIYSPASGSLDDHRKLSGRICTLSRLCCINRIFGEHPCR